MSLLALQDLFLRHREKATGVWRLGQDPNRTIFLEMGDVVFAQSTHPLDRLTHLLVERGKLTQAQLDYAMANLNAGYSIGKNLIEMGFITQRDLLDVAKAQVERVVWGAMATPDSVPVFEPKALDGAVVRLPFHAPTVLLSGLLNLRDRERVLELLGPLNQVVLLEARKLQELVLPPDLAKLPALMDGSRTLLELSRESGVEPFRLGAFSLFLREMGWARLHELPPLDRQALEMALQPQDGELSPELPEAPPAPAPSLIAEIEDSQRHTTNLEHLSQALDELPDPEAPASALPPVQAPPAPEPVALPQEPEAAGSEAPEPLSLTLPLEEPAPSLHLEPEPERSGPSAAEAAAPSGSNKGGLPPWAWVLLGILFIGGIYWGIARQLRRQPVPASKPPVQAPAPAPIPVPVPASVPVPPASAPVEPPKAPEAEKPKPEPKAEAPKPEASKPEPPKAATPEAQTRYATLKEGRMEEALVQGQAHQKALPGARWSLRLEVACQASTIQAAAGLLKGRDLFVLPIEMRDGKTCYQLMLGDYPSREAAMAAIEGLPPLFKADGNRPRPFPLSSVPAHQ